MIAGGKHRMRRFWISTLMASVLMMTAASADEVHRRQVRQQKRVAEGVKDGELTKQETKRIEKQEKQLHHEIKQDREDGRGLTPREKAKINAQENKLSREIYRNKHDAQKQPPKPAATTTPPAPQQ